MKRAIYISVLFFILVIPGVKNAGAQIYVLPSVQGEGIDSVTYGSRMGYRVTPDSLIASMVALGIMNPSIYNWLFSDGTTVLNLDGTVAAAVGGFYTDTAISAIINKTAGGNIINVSVAEQSVPKAGTGCTGESDSLIIQILPRPTINYTGVPKNGACSAVDDTIPLILTGYGPWSVDYTVSFNSGVPVAYNQIIGGVINKPGTTPLTTLSLIIPSSEFIGGQGTYVVQITNVRDRISLKSLDQSLIAAQKADLPAIDSILMYIYPTPKQKHIKHEQNL